ncbi:helix-turn-helix domain-containing protein [Marinifilum flexuosum]|uniref:helix-turn-helix domain-containing protein n=1 Tax=Marinifilum flexuosum TaxID=1117708 RepID=UPI002493BCA9|nr:helix-turn-helix domain-containing protein [Marinifilum flexuosum]
MELDKIFILLLDTIDMWQAISVGLFLLILNSKKKNSLLLLGIFLVVSGLSALSEIFDFFNAYMKNPFLDILSFNFLWLLPTLLYLYVERVSIEETKKSSYYLLIPGGIDFILNIGKFLLPLQMKTAIEESLAYALFELIGILFGLSLIVLIFRKIRKHSKLIKNQYSSIENRELKWLQIAILTIIISFVFAIVSEITFSGFIADLFQSLLGLFITFWIAYNGLLQQTSINLVGDGGSHTTKIKETPKSLSVDDKKEKQNQVVTKIKELLNEEKLYLNCDLTIVHIADKIGEHPRFVSGSINGICNVNFNRFINRYRVEEAKKLLQNNSSEHLNMEGVGFEAGFNSNSSFYSAFKNELNITPLQFLKNSNLGI